jgi:hypothetical protein
MKARLVTSCIGAIVLILLLVVLLRVCQEVLPVFCMPVDVRVLLTASPAIIPSSSPLRVRVLQELAEHSHEVAGSGNDHRAIIFLKKGNAGHESGSIRGSGILVEVQIGGGFLLKQSLGNSEISSVGLDDVDGDGLMDAWWCDSGDNRIVILWGNRSALDGKQSLSGFHARRSAFLDLDNDGQLDLVYETQRRGDSYDPGKLSYYGVRLSRLHGSRVRLNGSRVNGSRVRLTHYTLPRPARGAGWASRPTGTTGGGA